MNADIPAVGLKVEQKFFLPNFLIIVFMTYGLIWVSVRGALQALSLDGIWQAQIEPSSEKCVWIFFIQQVFNGIVEWFFHRYTLHAPLLPFLSSLFVKHHKVHHMLTLVRVVDDKWKNNYAIDHPRKYRASYFPFYTYGVFVTVFFGAIVLAQVMLPTWPVLMVSVFSIGWSLVMYETIHMMDHWPSWFWHPIFRLKVVGGPAQRLYAFHEFHHELSSRFKANMNISGFVCGIPIADWIFGTLRFPKKSFIDGSTVDWSDITPPTPRFAWIRHLDELADRAAAEFHPEKK